MARDKDKFMIKDFRIYKGSLDVNDQFSGTEYSYIKAGDSNLSFTKEFAEFFVNVPQGLVRKDLTKKSVMFECSIPQFEYDKMEDIFGCTLVEDTDYPNDYRLDFGADEPIQVEYAWKLDGALVDGSTFTCIIRKGRMIVEDASIAPSGTDHVTITAQIQAFEDESVSDRTLNYGFFLLQKPTS